MKKFLWSLLIIIFCFSSLGLTTYADFNVTLDPGHGGNASGAEKVYDGKVVSERDLNLKIALFVRQELSKYRTANGEKVNAYLTRDNNESNPSLADRAIIAKNNHSAVFISLHCNASPYPDNPTRGAMVLVTSSNFNGLYDKEEKFAKLILEELNKIGVLTTQPPYFKPAPMVKFNENSYKLKCELKDGLLRRLSDVGTLYPNGDLADWYGIIKNGTLQCIPTVLIEHCHLDFENDYRRFLSSDDQLRELAKADVRAIAKNFNLVKIDN